MSKARRGGCSYRTLRNSGRIWIGIIVKRPSPFDASSVVIVLAGSFGYGTQVAAQLATATEFLHKPEVALEHCECVFQVPIIGGVPGKPVLLLLRGQPDSR
jgi:hypothetical protein